MIRLHAVARTAAFSLALASAPAALADDRAEIMGTYEAMVAFGKFRTEGTADSKQGSANISSTVVWPDRFHVRNGESEFIIIPGKTWMKQGGRWQPLPMDMSAMVKSMSPEAMRQGYENMTNIKDLGTSEMNGHDVQGYEYDTKATVMGVTATSHVKVYIDTATKLPVHQDAASEARGQHTTSSFDYAFDKDIKVEAPL